LQMEITKRNSTKLCQMVDSTSRQQSAVEKSGLSVPKNWGQNFYICSIFRRFRDLMANICWKKRDIDNRAKALESTKGLLRCPKVSWTLVHKRLKPVPEFLHTITISFCPIPPHTVYAVLTWRPQRL